MINAQNSSIFFSSTMSNESKTAMAQEVGGVTCGNYDKYLGLPAFIGRSRYNNFRWIKERVWDKISNW